MPLCVRVRVFSYDCVHVADGSHAVWSNFEIADMDFWRSEAYQAYFDYLESKGGFYYEVSI